MAADRSVRVSGLASLRAGAVTLLITTHICFTTQADAAAGPIASRIGRVWPIAEPDALAEIEAATAKLPPIAPKFGPRAHWTALQSASLGVTTRKAIRSVIPFYTLDQDLRLPDGRLLYPKGFTFNPLRFVRLAQRLIIVHPRQLDWAMHQARPTDWIILAGGAGSFVDPLALGEKVGRPIFILEAAVKDRFGLTVAPVIVTQIGQKLELDEEPIDPSGTVRAASR